MKAIILGAGFGTRLKPLTDNTAKPLIPVAGKPIMEYSIDKVLQIPEIDEIIIVCNEKFNNNYLEWSKTKNYRIPLTVLNDGSTTNDNRLGAIGDTLFVIDQLKQPDDLLIIGGDNIFTFDLTGLFNYFKKNGNSIGVLDIKDKNQAKLYGVTLMDPDSRRIKEIEEKPVQPKSTLVSICMYMYSKQVIEKFREYKAEGNNMDAIGHFAAWLCRKTAVYGCKLDGTWFDIGDFNSLKKADEFFKKVK